MYRVLIVDDELSAREYMRGILDYRALGFEVVAEARNGRDGIEQFRRHSPHLVITDVVMPGMDGLAMADAIQQEASDCFFILLTSYNEFGYARRAIELSVKSYILKHEVDEALLREELLRIRPLLEERDRRNTLANWQRFKEFFQSEESALPAVLREWLEPFSQVQNIVLTTRLALCRGGDALEGLGQALLALQWECVSPVRLLFCDEGQAVLLAALEPESRGRLAQHQELLELCCRFQAAHRAWGGASAQIGVSAPFTGVESLAEAYRQAESALASRFFKPRNELFFYEASRSMQREAAREPRDGRTPLLEEFRQAVEHLDTLAAGKALRRLLLAEHPLLADRNALREDMDEILLALGKGIDLCRALREVQACADIEACHRYLAARVEEACALSASAYSAKTQQMLRYIHRNLGQSITLDDIAGHLGISPIYACQVFRREVGIPFKAYLNRRRVEKAAELLDSGGYRVYEVAELVGFQSATYFSNTFKRYMGRAPGRPAGTPGRTEEPI